MKKIFFLFVMLLTVLLAPDVSPVKAGDFNTGKNEFMLNGKPFVVRAGELHYSRIPKPYWDHRIKMCKAMGMNTICIYLFWNYHEMTPGVYDFSGDKNIAEFVKLIQDNGMYCIVRPGPYVCAEWEMGGLPWWLLKKKDLKVRTINDSYFVDRTKMFLNEAGKQLAPYQIQNGGPIIMVQVENEYGVWGNDQKYMETIRDGIREAGFDKVQLFRCDWSSNFDRYNVSGVASTLNFGAGSNIDDQFRRFKQLNPDAPLMCSEYWTGWFDHWGSPHETRSVNSFIGSLKDMMDRRVSFSLYMAHGGTSYSHWAGANAPSFAPTTSSYDYNAPIDEAGNATDKFYAVRNLLKNYLQEGETLADIPQMPEKTIRIPEITFTQYAPLFENLPAAKTIDTIQPMEMFDQGWGSIVYRTNIPASKLTRKLTIRDVHDWAAVYLNGKFVGKLDRRFGDREIVLPAVKAESRLDILVEAMGRINYSEAIIDRKGITKSVTLTDGKKATELKGWTVFNLHADYESQLKPVYKTSTVKGPGWYKATFNLTETGTTYLDMSNWGKGMVWVNGHGMGRFWKIGPTQTLCVPGCWLKKGENEILVFDVDYPAAATISGLDHPILDKTAQDESLLHRKVGQQLKLGKTKPVAKSSLTPGGGWKTVTLDKIKTGRYFCLEAVSAQDPKDSVASFAEMELIGEDGQVVSILEWRVLYADSEEVTDAFNPADKLFDQQESVIWQTQVTGKKPGYPHHVVVDMGSDVKVKAVRLLPRGDKNNRGMVKDLQFYLQKSPFKY